MQSDRQKQLIDTLNELDAQHVRFHDAKQQLIEDGYSEDEIAIAVASASFDGKPNRPKQPDDLHSSFQSNPDETKAIARELLAYDAHRQERKARLQALSAAAWGSRMNPMASQSLVTLADTLGVPIFRLAFIGLFIAAVLYGVMQLTHLIDIPTILAVLNIYGLLVFLYISFQLTITSVRAARLQKSVHGHRSKLAIVLRIGGTVLSLAIAAVLLYGLL
jgi:hypothetical protein